MKSSAEQIIAFISRFAASAANVDRLRERSEDESFTPSMSGARASNVAKPAHIGLMTLRAIRERDEARGEIVDFEWLYASNSAARMLGREPHELVGRHLLEVFDGQTAKDALLRHYKNVVERGKADEAECEHALDGRSRHYCHAAVRLGDGLVVTLTNLTAARQASAAALDLFGFDGVPRGAALAGE